MAGTEKNGREHGPVLGPLTFANLAQTGVFFSHPTKDAWGVARAPFSNQLARMSAELAAGVYDLDITPWLHAGWMDATFVVEDRVICLDREADTKLATLEAQWKRFRAKSFIQGVNPFGDVKRAARQLFMTDMGKSVVMTRAVDGRAVIAISFIGTTEKFFDWFANFKFHQEQGMHYGFLELARHFHAQASRVVLPGLAEALGEEAYTLQDALAEAARPEGRVTLWLSGHSQGGALVQTYAHLLMAQGTDPSRILAYSFAAPTVSMPGPGMDPKAYPIYNIINADDIVTRIGASLRLGVDCVYHPSDSFRWAHYRVEEGMRGAFERMLFICNQVQTTRDALCWGISFLRMMNEMGADEELESFFVKAVPYLPLVRRMGLEAETVAEYLLEKLCAHYQALTGQALDESHCAQYEGMMRTALSTFGAQETAAAMFKAVAAPHGLRPDKRDEGHVSPYIAIVRRHLSEMERGVWLPDTPCRCLNEGGEQLFPARVSAAYLAEGQAAQIDGAGEQPRLPEGAEG